MEEIILGLKVDTSGSKQSVAELESTLTNLKEKIKSVPTDSQAFKTLQAEIRKTDVELKNVNKSLEGAGKAQLAEGLGKIAGGASAAVAGFSLLSQALGSTKESAEEMQKSFNTAFGIMSGVKGIVELYQGLMTILPAVGTAFQSLSAIMAANPIGAVVVGITALIGGLLAFTSASEDAAESQEYLTEAEKEHQKAIEDLNKEYQKYTNVTDIVNTSIENQAKALNKVKEEVLELDKYLVAYSDTLKKYNGFYYESIENTNFDILSKQELIDLEDDIRKKLQDSRKALVESNKETAYAASILQKQLEVQVETRREIAANPMYTDVNLNNVLEYRMSLEETAKIEKQLLDLKKNSTEVSQTYTDSYNKAFPVLKKITEAIHQKNGVTKTEQKETEEATKKYEDYKKKLQEVADLLQKYGYIQKENIIRNNQEITSLQEEQQIELLKREEQFVEDKSEIERSEVLNAKQKADAIKIIEEQYRLDVLDINQKYNDKLKEQDAKYWEDKQKSQDEAFAYEQDLKKRDLLAKGELQALQNKNDLQSQINFLHAQRDAELMNVDLTASERLLIKQRYAQKEKELVDKNVQYELQKRAETFSSMQSLYSSFYSLIENIMQGNLEAFQRHQDEQLTVFDQSQQSQMALAEQSGENVAATEQRLAAEREMFLKKQAQEAKDRQKRAAQAELGLMLVQSIANVAAAILKAQVNPGYPLSIAEAVRIAALGVTEIAAITAQVNKINSFARGGIISGPSHDNGGVKYAVGGQVSELEGGEGVINKRSMMMPGVAEAASYLNQLGGGVAFNTSSVKQTQAVTLSSIISQNNDMIVRAYVLESEITDSQTLNNRIRNRAKF